MILIIITGLLYLTLLIVSILYLLKTPKEINMMYGYRTTLSMKNSDNWKYSNKLASRYLLVSTHLILLFDLIIYKIYSIGYLSFNSGLFLIIGLIPIVCFIVMVCIIEIKLKRRNAED